MLYQLREKLSDLEMTADPRLMSSFQSARLQSTSVCII